MSSDNVSILSLEISQSTYRFQLAHFKQVLYTCDGCKGIRMEEESLLAAAAFQPRVTSSPEPGEMIIC